MKEKGVSLITADMANLMLETSQTEHFNNVIKGEVRRGFNSSVVYKAGQTHLFEWMVLNADFIEQNGYNLIISNNNGAIHISW